MSLRRGAALFAFAALSSCRACSREVADASPPPTAEGGAAMSLAPSASASAALPSPAEATDTKADKLAGRVRFDCAGVTPASAPGPCGDERHEVDGLLERAEYLAEVPAKHQPPPEPYWDGFAERLLRAEKADGHLLEIDERISVQNAALHLALEAHATKRLALAKRALGLARRYAFPAATRPESTEPSADLELWLGPKSTWVERTRPGTFFHHQIHKNTRVFRLVRTARGPANFAQLVALDDMGRPFVTRVISGIEMRIGTDDDAPACVVLQSPKAVRCHRHAGLEVAHDPRDLPQSHFTMNATKTHIGCNGCHGNAPASNGMVLGIKDVPKAEVEKTLARRRAEVLDTLTLAIAAIDAAQ